MDVAICNLRVAKTCWGFDSNASQSNLDVSMMDVIPSSSEEKRDDQETMLNYSLISRIFEQWFDDCRVCRRQARTSLLWITLLYLERTVLNHPHGFHWMQSHLLRADHQPLMLSTTS